MVTNDEFESWKTHAVTTHFRKLLREKIGEIMEDWADGVFTQSTQAGTIQRNSNAIGMVQAYLAIEAMLTPDSDNEAS